MLADISSLDWWGHVRGKGVEVGGVTHMQFVNLYNELIREGAKPYEARGEIRDGIRDWLPDFIDVLDMLEERVDRTVRVHLETWRQSIGEPQASKAEFKSRIESTMEWDTYQPENISWLDDWDEH